MSLERAHYAAHWEKLVSGTSLGYGGLLLFLLNEVFFIEYLVTLYFHLSLLLRGALRADFFNGKDDEPGQLSRSCLNKL